MKIILRADGNASIGFGHLMRTLAFSVNIRDQADFLLLIRNPDALAIEACANYSVQYQDISAITFENEAEFVASQSTGKSLVFLDGYSFDEAYQKKIKESGCFLVCMDDHQDRKYLADCIINVAELASPSLVLKPISSKLVFGFNYALIRPEFTTTQFPDKNLKQVFICFGGGKETLPLIRKSVQAILQTNIYFTKILIVANKILLEEIQKIISEEKSHERFELHHSLKASEMADVLRKSSLAICSSSTIALECRAMNLPAVCGYYVDNQINIYNNLCIKGEICPAGNFNETTSSQLSELILQANETAVSPKQSIFNLNEIQKNYIKLLKAWEIEMDFSLRKASIEDSDLYLQWANHPDVRRNAILSEPILKDNHEKWFSSKVKNETALLLIAQWQGNSIGQVRFDLCDDIWEIDYSVDSNFRGKGFGDLLIRKGMQKLLERERKDIIVTGLVKLDNHASNQVFTKLHFIKQQPEVRSGVELNKFSLRLSTQFLYL
ncbi:MAG: bifunctional UDP-2,4-diacetamido-2,4,6-trideoxy-beta-L-altropyranose hydrolase/GNAT family N-acetyltransferase [Bacteroidia bacterium]